MIAASQGHQHVAVMATVLAASLLGFLMYNLPPASVFLGDSGSMVIGLSVGLLGIQGTLKTSATLAITAPAVVMTLPMFDIVAALVRRKLTGRRFDAPDRLHIHHRLLDRGWTPWQVLCLIGAVCLTTGAAATAATIFRRDALAWITAMTPGRADDPPAAVRLRGVCPGQESRRSGSQSLRGSWRWIWWRPGRQREVTAIGARVPSSEAPTALRPPCCGTSCSATFGRGTFIKWSSVRSKTSRSGGSAGSTPAMPIGEECRWSLSVSLPDPDGELCELRASSAKPITDEGDVAALTSLLKTFGVHFAAHIEQLFGPPAMPLNRPWPNASRSASQGSVSRRAGLGTVPRIEWQPERRGCGHQPSGVPPSSNHS